MDTLQFSVEIKAPAARVWEMLWNDTSYRKWTSAFMEGSYAESDWNEGSKIKFLAPDGEGMFGIIKEKVPNVQMTFQHYGEIKNGIEEEKNWAGAIESYHLEEKNGTTELTVKLDTDGSLDEYFNKTFPKALGILKQIAEE